MCPWENKNKYIKNYGMLSVFSKWIKTSAKTTYDTKFKSGGFLPFDLSQLFLNCGI